MAIDHSQLPLGKHTAYSDQYDPALLVAVPRIQTRDFWPTELALPFHGSDRWTAYELSWLNNKGKPQIGCLTLDYDATTTRIVESKSLKLYLNTFNQTRFSDPATLVQTITHDVGNIVGDAVSARLYDAATTRELTTSIWEYPCIDDLDISIEHYHVNASLLQCDHNTVVEKTVVSHLLRSNCPVTGQPDWASVLVTYRGANIPEESLLRYLCSYRLHEGFHEQCIERIFCDIWTHCQPEKLGIEGRFTRRGGLDINPFRASHRDMHASHVRQCRQ